jgi:hypothetical protein
MTTINITAGKKITLATLKSFIKNNRANLLIKVRSRFDGMQDAVASINGAVFTSADATDKNINHTLGIDGAWLVGHSNDRFKFFENETVIGVEVYNCCGTFILAVAKESTPVAKKDQPIMWIAA